MERRTPSRRIGRRRLIGALALATTGTALAACAEPPAPTPKPAAPAPTSPAGPAEKPAAAAAPAATPRPLLPAAAPTAAPTAIANAQLPADALPKDQQIVRFMAEDRPFADTSTSVYRTSTLQTITFEPLLRVNKDNEPIPGAAHKWEVVNGGATWRFFIRPGAKWSDGHPVTAHDFEFSYRKRIDPKYAYDFSWFYMDIKGAKAFAEGKTTDWSTVGVKAVDDTTLEMTTEKPIPYFGQIVGFRTSNPAPKHVEEKLGPNWSTSADTIVCNGSYKVDKWEKGKRIECVPNPEYNGPYQPALSRLIINIGEEGTHYGAYEAGETDIFTSALSPGDRAKAEKDAELAKQIHTFTQFTTWYLFFQTKKAPFDNLKLRQAVSHAIDREGLSKTILKGVGVPAYGMLPPGFAAYQGDKLQDLQAYSPDLAKKLLAEAGFPNGQGLPKIDLWLRNPTPVVKTVAEGIQQMLKTNLGLNVEVRGQEQKIYMDAMGKYDIPMSLISYGYDYYDPQNMLGDVWSYRPGGGGRHDWDNPKFGQLINDARGEQDPAKRVEMYREAEKVLVSDVGGVFVWHPVGVNMWRPNVKGPAVEPNKAGEAYFQPALNAWSNVYRSK